MSEVALREYVDRRLHDLDQRINERFRLAELALSKAEYMMEKRLDGMNEFREALKDQNQLMATRTEVAQVVEQVRALEQRGANLDGRLYAFGALVSIVVSVVVAGLVTVLLGGLGS